MPHHTYARDLFVSRINTNTIPDCQNNYYCFVIPKVKSANQNNLSYWGVKMWNVIPNIIKTATNVSMFKSATKRHYVILTHKSEESNF